MDSNERSKVEATIGSMPRQGRQGWQGRYLLPPLPPLPPLVLIFAVLPRPPIGAHGLSPTARRVVQRCGADRRLAGGRRAGGDGGPDEQGGGGEAADRLQEGRTRLPRMQREVFLLRAQQGLA